MSASVDSMMEEWRRRIQTSPDAKDARQNLEFHRTKIQELQENLREAEAYEAELEKRLNLVEDRLKLPVMRFEEKLSADSGVTSTIVAEIMEEVEDPSQIITLMNNKAKTLDQMTRLQLVGFIRTILNLRDSFSELEIEAGKDVMLEMAGRVLDHLGRPTINWTELSDWEAEVFRQLVREVEGVPAFLARLLDTILSQTVGRDRNNENLEIN